MRRISLRWTVVIVTVLLSLVPAVLLSRLVLPASLQSVQEMASDLLNLEADRVLVGMDGHLRLTHEVLNGLLGGSAPMGAIGQMHLWQQDPVVFETMATALTRQTPDLAGVFYADWRGSFLGVEAVSREAGGARVAIRTSEAEERRFFLARHPGDRSQPLAPDPRGFEPRVQPWYTHAVEARGRHFSPLQVDESRHELVLTLSQPVHDAEGVTQGVVGADLILAALSDDLRQQRVSMHGVSFVVDEQGVLVASSAESALMRDEVRGWVRRSARSSADAVVRAGFATLESTWSGRPARIVAAPDTVLRGEDLGDGSAVWMVQRPYGEALGLRWTLVVAAPEDDFTAPLKASRDTAYVFAGVFVLLAGALAWYFSQSLAGHLQRLRVIARAMGQGREVLPVTGVRFREISQLADDMTDNAWRVHRERDQLRTDVAALQESNESLLHFSEERASELAEARIEAQSATQAKTSFLSILSHEIRTPLNGVVGMSTLLAETPLDAEQRDYVQTLRLSSEQLLAVINDILDFSRIESGQMELDTAAVNLRTLIEEACDIAAPQAREKDLILLVDMPDAGADGFPTMVQADAARLRQVLINLLQNAIKFTPTGEVAVHARRLEQPGGPAGTALIEFRVIDSGIGIAPERVKTLFQAFSQVDVSPARRFSGTGLGLALCKGLVQLMGGQIGVESEPDQGSVFWFTVQAGVIENPFPENLPELHRLKSRRALIVHDQATNVRILRRQLSTWAMSVASAEGSTQALAWMQAAQERRKLPASAGIMSAGLPSGLPWMPDIIVIDMQLSEMDSVMLARNLRGRPEWAGIPLVLLSSGLMPPGSANARLFDARLLKPARQTQLCDALVRCLAPGRAFAAALCEPAPGDAGPRKTILVVDDIAVNRKVAAAMLAKLGFDVQQADGGREAVAAVSRAVASGPALAAILMDVNMPQVDGLE